MTQFEEAIADTMKVMAPPEIMTVSEWADKYRIISQGNAEPGPWDTTRAPYQKGIMDAFTDPEVENLVIMKSSQVGGTDMILNMIGYCVHKDPAPILTIQPTDTIAKAFSTDRLDPMIRDCAPLEGKVAEVKSRDKSKSLLHKAFPGGQITMAGANSPASLASRPIKNLFLDEVDRYPPSAGDEGDPVELAEKRTVTYWNSKTVLNSTPDNEETSRIEPAYQESNQQVYDVPCPECHKMQPLEWAYMKWNTDDEGKHDLETVHVECRYCQVWIVDEDKTEMLEAGVWRAQNPESKIAGFFINEMYSPWVTWRDMVERFLAAKHSRSRERLKVFFNTSLGQTWKEKSSTVNDDGLKDRAEDYGKDEKGNRVDIPEGVLVLTAAIDVQDDRLEMECVGWGDGKESWGIDYNVIYGDPEKDEVWSECLAWLKVPRKRLSGLIMAIRSVCVDSGGHHTQKVYKVCKANERIGFKAIKGEGGEGKPFLKRPTKNNTPKCRLYNLGVDEAKSNLYYNLKHEEAGPNYCHFPTGRGYDADWFKQLTSEQKLVKWVKGDKSYYWRMKKGHNKNEALDIRVYNMAAIELFNPNFDLFRKDIEAKELVCGGSIVSTSQGTELKELGATVFDGVKAAADAIKEQIKINLHLK